MTQRLLLCDDDLFILRAAQFKLERAGFEVRTAGDGQEAWEAIQIERPDLLVTDLQMPRLNGLELVGRLRGDEATRSLPVIMLTAKGYELNREDLMRRLGLVAILAKPFSPRELAGLVQQTLGNVPAGL